ncbi:twin-arginine translocase subunit TatC [Dysgonomonas macrotermitis]|uniref:Sec-independent protein translocase protein TatC n=1 Tax=Dysgonomonas macrotermitis TaxID=1346286 RepID=A0A1M5GP77_9BACT|nr:twin-arginine translocase subunit TatC [Dysgonomonas macrotermitis]SHG05539.1 sec-independent protein translocase protein TatC [Dysgonomonas macrotermitis]
MSTKTLTFWEHLDELRASLIRIVIVTVIFGFIAFFFKDYLFSLVLAPKNESFVTYTIFRDISNFFLSSGNEGEAFSVQLINTGLAEQFVIHMKVAMYAGLLCASPYILYLLFRFVAPALYSNEKRYAFRVVLGGYIMFLLGVLLNYFLIFPLTFRFLGTYQVSTEVVNMISLHSYVDTLMMLSLMMGLVFEIPILCWLFAKFGFLSAPFMRKYRRHAIVILLVISAVITPTTDIFTLLLVAMPMYLLYEISILIVMRCNKIEEVL